MLLYCNNLLPSVASDGKDRNGLKFEKKKTDQYFSSSAENTSVGTGHRFLWVM